MAWGKHRTEHGGPKHGKAINRKAWVKRASRKQRRAEDRGWSSTSSPTKGPARVPSCESPSIALRFFGGRQNG